MCPTCDRPFGRRQRCYYCQPGRKRSGITRSCEVCQKPFPVPAWKVQRGEGRFCSYACKNDSMRGQERRPGTRYIRPDGYVAIKTGIRSYRLEHRMVMEQQLGRPLRADEQINHINHIRDDNRPENLEILSAAEHTRETNAYAAMRRRKEREELKALRLAVAAYRERYGPLT
jgi:hypothetical protein